MESLRALERSIIVCACVALPLVLAGASLASNTVAKQAPHKPSVRHSAKKIAGTAPKPKFEAKTVLVKFLKPSNAATAVRAAHDTPVRGIAGGVEVVKLQPGESVAAKVREYDRRPDVAYAEPNYLLHAAALPAPNDVLYANSQQGAIDTIHAAAGWSIFPGSYQPVAATPPIAIVDSGIASGHEDLAGRVQSQGADCTATPPTCVAAAAPADISNDKHGTEVAGIAGAATNNGLGIAGVAYSSPLISVRVLNSNDSASFATAASGITWAADHGAKVINVSFGGAGFSATLCDAVTHAISVGAVVVAAAGNSGDSARNGSAVPFYPAACPGAVGVAATFNNDASPIFSNFGFPDVFMSAPGVNQISANPDNTPGPYTTPSLTGTSFAAPFVSGAAALLFGQYASRTNTDVKRVLARTAIKAGAPVFPYGADPFHTCAVCTWSQFYGYGRVDLLAALAGPTPVITGVSPASGKVGEAVTIDGLDLTGASSVRFGVTATGAPTPVNSGRVTTTVPAGASNGHLTITTPSGTSAPSPGAFQIVPTLSATSGKVGDTITISGPKLDDAPMVSFGGAAPTGAVVDSPSQIHITIPTAARTGRVTVATATSGLTPYTSAELFTVTPTISLVTPAGAAAGSPVMIQGTGFSGLTSLTFNGIPATFSGVTPAAIRTHVPANATTGKIQVTTVGGTALTASDFGVKPTVASFLPTRGTVTSPVTITGSGFSGTPTVEFNGTPSGSVTVLSATALRATVPDGATSGKIRVTTADGTSLSGASFLLQPRITGISPSPELGAPAGDAVTIAGTSFTGATAVRFNGVNASFTVDSETQITTTVPSAATTGLVTVVTPADTAVFPTAFKVKPTITGISPDSGQTGSLVTITGKTFAGATSVAFNGVASGFTVVDPGTIQATVPTTATNGPITVTTPGGSASSTDFSLLPKVLSFSPTSGATGTQVTITGTAFGADVTDVKFGSAGADPASIQRVSSTSVKANVPPGASTGQITVVTDGGQDTSLNNFVVRLGITALSPLSGPEGAQVEIDGVGFTTTSEVRFGGVLAGTRTVHPEGTRIDATVPIGALTGKITVKTGSGSTALTATSGQPFTVAPTITGFTPLSGPVGAAVTVDGLNLQGTTRVDFGGIPQTSLTVNPAGTSISTTVPDGALPGPISLLTPLAVTESSTSFAVLPTVTSVSPVSGHVGATVELTGTSLSLVDSVDFDGTDAPDFWPGADDSHLEVKVPSGATTGVITVHDADGHTAHTAGNFTLTPGISTFAPASGTAGDSVVISGTDLAGATSVTFNGTASTFNVDSVTQITATVPAGATSGEIAVTTPTGSDTSAEDFLVPAAIAGFDPPSGSGGDTITISGAGFATVSAVSFNAVPATFSVVSGTTITAQVPATATTGRITVTTDAGTATSGTDFTVVPVVESVSPPTGLAGSVVTITGRNLGMVTGVDFGGLPAVFGMISPTQITATVPDDAATGAIRVHTLASATAVTGPTYTVAPSVLGFTPVDGPPGATISLHGSGLANVVGVTFGGGAGTAPAATSANALTVVVPGAAVTGPITVTDGTNASTSDDVFAVD